jgi:hypothetical protein
MSQTKQIHLVFNLFPDLEHVFQFRADCWHWWQKYKSHGGLVIWRARSNICNYTGQQNLNFFVPQTLIVELRSTFYAEFRYVNRIVLSGTVSKIQRNLNVRNITLRAHVTGRNIPLKC